MGAGVRGCREWYAVGMTPVGVGRWSCLLLPTYAGAFEATFKYHVQGEWRWGGSPGRNTRLLVSPPAAGAAFDTSFGGMIALTRAQRAAAAAVASSGYGACRDALTVGPAVVAYAAALVGVLVAPAEAAPDVAVLLTGARGLQGGSLPTRLLRAAYCYGPGADSITTSLARAAFARPVALPLEGGAGCGSGDDDCSGLTVSVCAGGAEPGQPAGGVPCAWRRGDERSPHRRTGGELSARQRAMLLMLRWTLSHAGAWRARVRGGTRRVTRCAADGSNVLCGLVAELLTTCVYSCAADVTDTFVHETVGALCAAPVNAAARQIAGNILGALIAAGNAAQGKASSDLPDAVAIAVAAALSAHEDDWTALAAGHADSETVAAAAAHSAMALVLLLGRCASSVGGSAAAAFAMRSRGSADSLATAAAAATAASSVQATAGRTPLVVPRRNASSPGLGGGAALGRSPAPPRACRGPCGGCALLSAADLTVADRSDSGSEWSDSGTGSARSDGEGGASLGRRSQLHRPLAQCAWSLVARAVVHHAMLLAATVLEEADEVEGSGLLSKDFTAALACTAMVVRACPLLRDAALRHVLHAWPSGRSNNGSTLIALCARVLCDGLQAHMESPDLAGRAVVGAGTLVRRCDCARARELCARARPCAILHLCCGGALARTPPGERT